MHRQTLLNKLKAYSPENEEELVFRASFLTFMANNANCFERSLLEGHITGSAWIVNKTGDKALLTHHKKLNRWLQLGGHADGETDIIKVATNEAIEESGLTSLTLVSQSIFDIDIHPIPARGHEPEHLHYDVRFLYEADEHEPLKVSDESHNLGWISFSELAHYTANNASILRMAEKSSLLSGNKQ